MQDMGSTPGSGRFPGEGNLLQCSRLGNPMDRAAWWALGHGVAESDTVSVKIFREEERPVLRFSCSRCCRHEQVIK